MSVNHIKEELVAGSLRDSNAKARIQMLRIWRTIDGRQEHLFPLPELRGAHRTLRALQKSGCKLYLSKSRVQV